MSEKSVHVTIGARTHEEAAVVSARFQLSLKTPGDLPALIDSLTAGMRQLNAWAEENSVIIGHIKGYVSWDQEAVMVSTTGSDVQVKGSAALPEPPCTVEVGTAAIVFGVGPDAMEKRMEQFIEPALKELGFAVDIEHEEEHHHDHEHGGDGCGEHEHHHDHEHSGDGHGAHGHHHDHDHGEDGCGEHEHHHDHDHGEDGCGEHEHHHDHDNSEDGCGEHEHHHDHDYK